MSYNIIHNSGLGNAASLWNNIKVNNIELSGDFTVSAQNTYQPNTVSSFSYNGALLDAQISLVKIGTTVNAKISQLSTVNMAAGFFQTAARLPAGFVPVDDIVIPVIVNNRTSAGVLGTIVIRDALGDVDNSQRICLTLGVAGNAFTGFTAGSGIVGSYSDVCFSYTV